MSHKPPTPHSDVDLSSVLDDLREGLQIIDREFRYVYVNAAAAAHGRRPAEELVGQTMVACYPGIERTPLFETLQKTMSDGVARNFENEFRFPDGASGIFELRVQPCDVGLVVLSIDVTEERRLERQLRHAQKMEAIGRLAGSVAHDFNNLLSVILSYSALLLEQLNPTDPIRPDLEAIERAGERAGDLTRQLLAFSRQQVLAPRLVDLNDVVAESERMLRRLLGEDVELTVHCERRLAKIVVDPGQVEQVIMNLVINARDAMPEGGKLTIETRAVDLDATYAAEHLGVCAGRYVLLAVSDSGHGMDKETQARIFEPFFTTKELGKGTGLGLSTVFGIVQQSRGSVWVYSEVGAGTTFKVYFPVAPENVATAEPPPDPVTLEGSETVLLVEDQAEVREVARQVLRRYGYHVLVASNAGEALLHCERHPLPIQVLLTDVVMPQMNGR
ncbi:MAG: PAS domain-containing protein, partial [Myxococcales bacterium]|nr:PAS domain-containing protein [Myxococcales bacterium]